jgi:hypothetical protein
MRSKIGKLTILIIFLFTCSFLWGCCGMSLVRPDTSKNPTVSQVINQLKDELNAYMARQPDAIPNVGICYSGKKPMNLIPSKVTVTLQAMTGQENDPSAGLTIPIGNISLGPSFSGSYSQQKTQALTIPLNIPVEYLKKPQPVDHNRSYPIADAIAQFRDEIIRVDHKKVPCLQADNRNPLKLSLAFDVNNATTVGGNVTLVVFNVGDKEILTGQTHQQLDIEFSIVPNTGTGRPGGVMLMAKPKPPKNPK